MPREFHPESKERFMRYSDDPNKDDVPDEYVSLALNLAQQAYTGNAGDPNQEVAWYTGWSYMGINAKATQAAGAKPVIYDSRIETSGGDDDDQLEKAAKDFRWWRLLKNPSPWQTGRQMRQENVMQLGIHGVSIVWNVKNGWGKTQWRIPIPVSLVTPIQPGYRQNMEYGGIRVHPSQWINRHFYIPVSQNQRIGMIANREISVTDLTITAFPHPVLRGDGFSPQTAAAKWNALVQSSETAQAQQYKNGSNKKVLLPLPETIDPTTAEFDAYQRKINKWMADDDMGFVAMPQVAGAMTVSVEPDQMAYQIATDTYGPAILALNGTPKAAVGLSENQTYGANAAAINAWTRLSVQPTLDLLADEDTATMRMEEGPAFTIEYEAEGFNDPELEIQETAQDISSGIITVGEMRKKRNMKPFGDERDDMIAGGAAIMQWGAPKQEAPGGVPPMMQGAPEVGKGAPEQGIPPGTPEEDAEITQQQPTQKQALPGITKSMFRQSAMVPFEEHERAPVIAFDLDGTLAESLPTYQPGIIGEPRHRMIELTKMLREAGCNIVVYTARNEDRAVARWLDAAGVPFCGINENPYMGQAHNGAKMLFDVLIDDRVTDARTTEGIVLRGIIDQVSPEWGDRIVNKLKGSEIERRYGYIFAPIGGTIASKIRDLQAMIDPQHLLGTGIESELHVTVLHGMVGDYESDMPRIFSQVSAPMFRLENSLSIFGQKPTVDGLPGKVALVVELSSPELQDVYSVAARSFAHVNSFPTYKPHITLAYIDERFIEHYKGVSVARVSGKIEKLIYRHQSQPDLIIPLRG